MKTAKEIAESLRWFANARVRKLTPELLAGSHHESIANALVMLADDVERVQADALEAAQLAFLGAIGRAMAKGLPADAGVAEELTESIRKLKESL